MKAQYRILGQLKRIDEKILRLQTELDRIPGELKALDDKIAAQRDTYNLAKANFDSNEKQLRKTELDLKEKEEFIRKAEGKMMECKTNEEYQAAQREIDGFKKDKSGIEEQVLTLITALDEHRKTLKDAEKIYKDAESLIIKDKKEFEDERTKHLRLFEEQTQIRSGIVAQLAPEVSSLYLKVSKIVRGAPIVLAENGSCLGCNMKVRHQLFNEILSGRVIHRCPNCGRILVTAACEIDENATPAV